MIPLITLAADPHAHGGGVVENKWIRLELVIDIRYIFGISTFSSPGCVMEPANRQLKKKYEKLQIFERM